MFTATADDFAAHLRHEMRWLAVVRWLIDPQRDHERSWWLLRVLLTPIAMLGMVAFAQIIPFLVERAVRPLLPQLPSITDRALLARVEDFFRLLHAELKVIGRFSIFRARVNYWLEELDEQLDSFEFVREHGAELDATIAEIRADHSRKSAH